MKRLKVELVLDVGSVYNAMSRRDGITLPCKAKATQNALQSCKAELQISHAKREIRTAHKLHLAHKHNAHNAHKIIPRLLTIPNNEDGEKKTYKIKF